EVVQQDGPRFLALGCDDCCRHPVDEIALEHGGVSCDDPTTLFAGELFRVGQLIDELVDDLGHVPFKQFHTVRGLTSRQGTHGTSSGRGCDECTSDNAGALVRSIANAMPCFVGWGSMDLKSH